jgi:UDP-N-acetylglucosamine--N-acetylmuramyl-(pentapeptide) pyrophosphoryl-undecaprenol N-acetylglucosamine transferase
VKRVVLCTGGTGGHIFPALAVAEELQDRFSGIKILFVGGIKGPERRMAEKAGLEFRALPAQGVLGKGLRSVSSIFWLSRSLLRAWNLYRSFKPEVVLGLGGYAGFAPALAACWKRIPVAIHEQNSLPGMTNRMLGKRVQKVFLSFADDEGFFDPQKVFVTGNPVRKDLLKLRDQKSRHTPEFGGRVLVLGGSQGAKAINQAVLEALHSFKSQAIQLWHQTGKDDLELVRQKLAEQEMGSSLAEDFIEDMAEAYAWADVVICRAGATTIAELTAVGKPSILIPFPYATHDHQMNNARSLEKAGAAMLIGQSHLEEMNLGLVVGDLIAMPGRLKEMGRAARKLGHPEAARIIVDKLQEMTTTDAD